MDRSSIVQHGAECAGEPRLVTILIATKDRPDDLRATLAMLKRQTWPAIELIVIDDGSRERLEPVVREHWPGAEYIRHETSAGQCQRRSEGFQLAKGEFILQLDDDSCPVQPDALEKAVRFQQAGPEIGILSFHIFNGQDLPADLPMPAARYHQSFVGCGALVRTEAVRQTGGYRDFFQNEWEEEELSLRVLKAGWSIYFFSSVLIHHRVSPRNRRTARTWSRGFRNKLWSLVMHFPARKLPIEMTWVLGIAFYDSIRLMRFGSFVRGVWQFLAGLPNALRLRDPMSAIVLRRYEALRFRGIFTQDEFINPPRLGWNDLRGWFRSWLNRPRQRSVWDRKAGDVGESATVAFAHGVKPARSQAPQAGDE